MSSQEKTEQATEKKLRDSKKKGDIPQQKNFSAGMLIIATLVLIFAFWPRLSSSMTDLLILMTSAPNRPFHLILYEASGLILEISLYQLLPFIAILALVTIALTLVTAKLTFSFEKIKPNFGNLHPSKYFKRVFSLDNLYSTAHIITTTTFVFIILFYVIYYNIENAINSSACGANCMQSFIYIILIIFLILVGTLTFILSVLDYRLQIIFFLKKQKMTKDEIKREHKESQGNPEVKSSQRNIAHEIVSGPSLQDVFFAIAGNKYLVAFQYDKINAPIPIVVAKAHGDQVAQLKKKISAAGKKIAIRPTLSETLYMNYTNGQALRQEHFEPIIEILFSENTDA